MTSRYLGYAVAAAAVIAVVLAIVVIRMPEQPSATDVETAAAAPTSVAGAETAQPQVDAPERPAVGVADAITVDPQEDGEVTPATAEDATPRPTGAGDDTQPAAAPVTDTDAEAGTVLAATQPGEQPGDAAATSPSDTDTANNAAGVEEGATPVLDLVRVDETGGGLVAGTAPPNAQVTITLGGQPLETVTAGADGSFASFVTIPQDTAPAPLRLQLAGDGPARYSEQTVLIVPPKRGQAQRPTLVLADASGASIVQPPEPEESSVPAAAETAAPQRNAPAPVRQSLSLDTISYDDAGEVILSGRGEGAQFVRVYVDNAPVLTEPVAEDGNWRVTLDGVKAGTYTLRVDQISPAGVVQSRVESPFRRETPADVAAAARASPDRSSVTVQPGHSLWVLAEERYGDGVRYVQIFEANRDRIRNPDLIYPGQIFDLPDDG